MAPTTRSNNFTSSFKGPDAATNGNYSAGKPRVTAASRFVGRQRLKTVAQFAALGGSDLLAVVLANIFPPLLMAGTPGALWAEAAENSARQGFGWHAWGVALLTCVLISHLVGRGHYRHRITFWAQALDVTSACILTLACDLMLTALIYDEPLTIVPFLRWLALPILLLAARSVSWRQLDRVGLWQMRVLVFGRDEERERVSQILTADAAMGYVIAGAVDPSVCRALRQPAEWYAIMLERGADMVAMTGAGSGTGSGDGNLLATLSLTGVPVMVIPECGPMAVVGVQPQYVPGQDAMLMTCQPRLIEPVSKLVKSLMDYAASAFFCIFFAPLFLAIAVAVKVDGGPVVFRHRRIGAGGKPFMCLKFRSMKLNSDQILAELLESDAAAAAEWATSRKLTNDPRITPVGRLLRLTSLDELPQLWNVLRGEMSLVGPRPIVQAEVEFYGRWFGFYTHMKPGLTGLWQASGRSKTTYSHRVQLDVWYARNWSLWQDIAILLMTVPAVLLRKGAM